MGDLDARQLSRAGLSGVRSLPRRAGAARSAGRRRRRRESSPADGGPRAEGGGLRRSAAGRRCDRHRRGASAAGGRGELSRLRGLEPAAAVAVARCRSGVARERRAPRGAGDVRADARSSLVDLEDALRGPRERTEFKEWPALGRSNRSSACKRCWMSSSRRWARQRKDHAGLAALRRRGAELAARLRILIAADEDDSRRACAGRNRRRTACRCTTCPSMWPNSSARSSSRTRARGSARRRRSRSATVSITSSARLGMREATTARFGSPFELRATDVAVSAARTRSAVVAAAHGAGHRCRAAGAARQPVGARSCCSRVIARCATAAEILLRRLGPTLPFPVLVQGDGAARVAAVEVSRVRQRRAARDQQLLGRRRRQRRRAVGRRHRQAAVRGARRSRAEGAAGCDRAARRQSVLRRADSAGGDRAEAGRRPPDARSERLRRRHAVRSAPAHARLRQDLPRQPAADAAHRAARRGRAVPVREARDGRDRSRRSSPRRAAP